ncbi:MAG TPA: hypothetical protein VFV34_27825 [Blastocatellia bacterium]|nr:hypothetical protein [Blastocatellia bacterium]
MSNILKLDDKGSQPTYYSLSPAYSEAVNASRFVKGFGITALVQSLLMFTGINLLGAGVGLGIGLLS